MEPTYCNKHKPLPGCPECAVEAYKGEGEALKSERDRYKRALEDISGRGMSMYANQVDAFVDCRNIARKALNEDNDRA